MFTSYISVMTTGWDFVPTQNESGGLPVQRGQMLLLMDKSHEMWWKFKVKTDRRHNDGRIGFVPMSTRSKAKAISTVVACKDYVAGADGDLTITQHETLSVYGVEGKWVLVGHGIAAGYVPRTCIKLEGEMDRVVALVNYRARARGKLSFRKGDILTVLNRQSDRWWYCKNTNQEVGMVSSNCVKVETSSEPGSTPIGDEAPISKHMGIPEVASHLVAHGCKDLSRNVDLSTFADHPISQGGFSDVYRGRLSDGTLVAVKTIRIMIKNMGPDPKHLKHAARELHTWGKCNHPNIVPLLGLVVFRGRIGMVSPWMQRGNLSQYLELTPEANRHYICVQICEGLAYLHQIGVVHGDLKGANVLISDEGLPVLTDFGNSLMVDQTMKFTHTTSVGARTVRWAAAEIIQESSPHSEASDVYALGMNIRFRMSTAKQEVATGKLPYDDKKEHTIIYLVVVKKEVPDRPEKMFFRSESRDQLWELLLRCWSFEPTARPSAVEVTEVMKTIGAREDHIPEAVEDHEHIEKKQYQNLFRNKSRDGRRKHERGSDREHRERDRAKSEGRAREALEAHERADKERARSANSASAVFQAWVAYDQACSELMEVKPSDGKVSSNLTFYDIPWPVLGQANSFRDLTNQNIAAFLLSPHHSQDKSPKARLRAAIIRFAQKVVSRVAESHRPAIVAAVNLVARTITELISVQGD
ncbi:unnamed protein product [Rhizoctonia solani]|uniref:mitogen-activated protein kinase kinase kinase n=1 Tax=Rhizoctonia solani TaxID=456999 RepID=A0A8H3H8J9_9AGAM|nr:unnamed protein product [Rhizoctonia solani]